MKDLFEENLFKLSLRSPKSAIFLPYIGEDSYRFCLTQAEELNLTNGQFFFHSPQSATLEAIASLQPFLTDEVEVIIIFGIGLGYSYFAARQWLRQNKARKLIFLEDDLALIKCFLKTERCCEVLDNEQVRLVPIDPSALLNGEGAVDGIDALIDCCEKPYHILALPSYITHKISDVQKVMQGIRSLIFMFAGRLSDDRDYSESVFNFYMKLMQIHHSIPFKELLGAFSEVPCIICGAGPSLAEDLPLLKSLSDSAIIFGAGTAMNILNAHGIYPHFGGGVDPTDVQLSRIRTNTAYETPYFYTNRFNYLAFNELHGINIFTPQIPEKKWRQWFQNKLGIESLYAVDIGFSTANFCTSVALFLGCNPIIYLGMDMAFERGEKYTPGASGHPTDKGQAVAESFQKSLSETTLVTNCEGKTFETTLTFVNESGWMTSLALKHPEKTFIYGSKKGFGVNKVTRLSLEEIVQKYFKQKFDLQGQIHAALQETKKSIQSKAVYEALVIWQDSLKRCIALLDCLMNECRLRQQALVVREKISFFYSGKWVFYETELHEEIAFQSFLEDVETAAEIRQASQALNLKHQGEEFLIEQFELIFERYEIMKMAAEDHLEALKTAKALYLDVLETRGFFKNELKNAVYSFEHGLLKISDPQIGLEVEEMFHPLLIPHNIQESPQWKSHEPVGQVYAYVNGVKEGENLLFYGDGSLRARQYFWEGLLHGPSTFYSKEGKLLCQSWFLKGKREGRVEKYHLSGKVYAIEYWQNDLKEGVQQYFYPEGTLKSSLSFTKGLLNGETALYYKNGNLKLKIHFKNGLREGKESIFNSHGDCLSEVCYQHNHPVK